MALSLTRFCLQPDVISFVDDTMEACRRFQSATFLRTMIQITPTIQVPESELSWTFVRSSGPGGQNVNKVASKAVLRWDLPANTSIPADVKQRLRT